MTDTGPGPDDPEDYDDYSDMRMDEEMRRGADIPPDPEDAPAGEQQGAGPMSRPVLGTQAADDAAWDEIAAALASASVLIDGVMTTLDNDTAQDLVAAVTPVLVRLVDQAVAATRQEDGGRLRHVNSWDQVHLLVARWRAGEAPCGAMGRPWSERLRSTHPAGPCLLSPEHELPGHDDGNGGRW
jgi:hypothetical protein